MRRAVAVSLLSLMQWPLVLLPYPLGVAEGWWDKVEWPQLRLMILPVLMLLWIANATVVFPKLKDGVMEDRIRELPAWLVEFAGPLTLLLAVAAMVLAMVERRLMVG